jgi:hypothetical protein
MSDYLVANTINSEQLSWRHFWMERKSFLQIIEAVKEYDLYFHYCPNAMRKLRRSSIHNITVAL